MKKLVLSMICFAVCMCIVPMAMAGALFPKVDGDDVLVPQRVINAIPGYVYDQPVYAAHDANRWAPSNGEDQMVQEGEYWRASGVAGYRFHPVQLNAEAKPVWSKIEVVYPLEMEFVDTSGTGPCLLVK